ELRVKTLRIFQPCAGVDEVVGLDHIRRQSGVTQILVRRFRQQARAVDKMPPECSDRRRARKTRSHADDRKAFRPSRRCRTSLRRFRLTRVSAQVSALQQTLWLPGGLSYSSGNSV